MAKVQVTVNAPGEDAVTKDLTGSSIQWSGILSGLAEGTDRTFDAVALDAGGARLYTGRAAGVVLADGEDTLVFITLDELTASTATQPEAPILTSLTAHPAEVRAGSTVTLRATARDRNPGDTIRLEWTAPGGAFSSLADGAISWTAPSSGASLQLGCTASDTQGLSSSLSIPISVRAVSSAGSGSGGRVCCKHCGGSSKPCGDSCINSSYTCSKPAGCACY
ncbi:MAG TPA: hypothetical protein VFZ09_50565 [Archangium sp.]|uniref:hypothetical protein n=1 Tax=Archangium sp. TaxID=1872627 RepID=UPI002E317D3B|nr:hypothetical protein [Archangium sp.]HEX5754529.1 hypothetical protein [Archangium sp.]